MSRAASVKAVPPARSPERQALADAIASAAGLEAALAERQAAAEALRERRWRASDSLDELRRAMEAVEPTAGDELVEAVLADRTISRTGPTAADLAEAEKLLADVKAAEAVVQKRIEEIETAQKYAGPEIEAALRKAAATDPVVVTLQERYRRAAIEFLGLQRLFRGSPLGRELGSDGGWNRFLYVDRHGHPLNVEPCPWAPTLAALRFDPDAVFAPADAELRGAPEPV